MAISAININLGFVIILTLDIFITTVVLVFLAELGDKTMLATMLLSAQYQRPHIVLLASMLALTTSSIIAVIIGYYLSSTLPLNLIYYLSGALFIIIGCYTLFTAEHTEKVSEISSASFSSMFLLVFIAELGDKTQLTALVLAAQSNFPLLIILGAFFGFLMVNGIGALTGEKLAEFTPIIWVKRVTGIVFILVGVVSAFGIFS